MKGIFGYDSPLMGALTAIGDCICLSVLWLVFSLPVVTIGASTTALYSAAYHSVRKKEGGLWRLFWGPFKENLRRSTLLWAVVFVVLALLTADVFILRGMSVAGKAFGRLYTVGLVLWCLGITWAVYVAAYAARFSGKVLEVLKFAGMLMVLHPIRMLGVMAPVLISIALTLLIPFMALIGPGAVFVIVSFTTEKVFRLHMRPEDLAKETGKEMIVDEDTEDGDDDQ